MRTILLANCLFALGGVLAPLAVHAASLRPMTTLESATVKLSDLFDDAGPQADRVLGPGPAPGARIVVEAPQLAAIASQFGVGWHPNSPGDRAILERQGRPLPREDVLEALRGALRGAGGEDACDVELVGFSPPLVADGASARTAVEQLDQEPGGRFSATITVFSDGLAPQRLRVAGRVSATIELPVATRKLQPGTLLRATDLHLARVHASSVATEVAQDPEQVVGQVLRHLVMPGQPFPSADLARQAMIKKNDKVTLALSAPGLDLAGQGIALESGAMGDQIQVMNPSSRQIVQALITGPDSARIAAGAAPVALGRRGPAPQVAER